MHAEIKLTSTTLLYVRLRLARKLLVVSVDRSNGLLLMSSLIRNFVMIVSVYTYMTAFTLNHFHLSGISVLQKKNRW